MPKVRIAGVRKQFSPSHPGASPLLVLDDVNLDIAEGEFCSFVGASGCGKSTLLNVIAGLLPASSGKVFIDGEESKGIPGKCGYMFQKDTLLPWCTVRDNIRLPLEVQGKASDVSIDPFIKLVGLTGFEGHFPHQISGGMRKRAQLARVLVQGTDILMMDEPFGSLDAQTRMVVQEEFLRIWEQDRKTVLFVTHDLHEAIILSDRIVVMSRKPGRVKRVYKVPLPRPRSIETVLSNPVANELFREIWQDLRDEVQASFEGVG